MPEIKLAHTDPEAHDDIASWAKAYRSEAALPCSFCGTESGVFTKDAA
jgi:hypothetical protein